VNFRSALERSFLESYSNFIDESWIKELRSICTVYINYSLSDSVSQGHYNCQFHLKLFSGKKRMDDHFVSLK